MRGCAMVFDLVSVVRRWPSLTIAMLLHLAAVGVLVLIPVHEPDHVIIIDNGPPMRAPRAPRGGPTSGTDGGPRRTIRDKNILHPQPPTVVPVDVSTASEPASPSDASNVMDGNTGGPGDGPEGPHGPGGQEGPEPGLGNEPGPTVEPVPDPDLSSVPRPILSNVDPPTLVDRVDPEYPSIARSHGIHGTVVLKCIIGVDGNVQVERVVRSVPMLDAAATRAVEQWRYSPATVDGRPQAVFLTVRVEFSLGG
jgi:protein TonB